MYVAGTGPTGVLVLSGSSGRVEAEKCDLLAAAGATAVSYAWFAEPGVGGPGGGVIDRVPLESFEGALARLHERCDRLVVLGTSRGAEAALLLGALHPEIDAVVAVSPSDVVWAALAEDRPQRSSWTRGGEPLPFVPYDDDWVPATDPPQYRGLYLASLERFADRVPAARVPVERVAGEVVLTAGGDDRLWPSMDFTDRVLARRQAAGRSTTRLLHPGAGHRVLLPGETAHPPALVHGGTPAADAELGVALWSHVLRLIGPGGGGPLAPDGRFGEQPRER